MARLATSGFELKSFVTVAADSPPDGIAAGTTAPVTEATIVRSGAASAKCSGTSANTSYMYQAVAPASGVELFDRHYFRISALPNATKKIAAYVPASGGLVSARLTSAGKLQLWNDVLGTQIGSDSILTIAVDKFYRLQIAMSWGTGLTDVAELRILDTTDPNATEQTVASTSSLSLFTSAPTQMRVGWVDAPGVMSDMFLDDWAINDSSGTKQNSWPGEGQVVLLRALAVYDFALGWVTCKNTQTAADFQQAFSATPPVGHADATNHTTAHQVRDGDNSGTSQLVYDMDSFAKAGAKGNVFGYENIAVSSDQNIGDTVELNKYAQALYFNGTLDYLEVACDKVGSPTGNLTIEIQTDSSGLPSGTALASWSFTPGQIPDSTSPGATWMRSPSLALPLTPLTRYWIAASTTTIDPNNYYELRIGGGLSENARYGSGGWVSQFGLIAFRAFSSTGASVVRTVRAVICDGEAIATGTKSGTLEVVQNPVISPTSFDFGDSVGAAGAYPGNNWRWHKTAVAYDPAFSSVGAIPRIQLKKTDTTTRVALACFLGINAEIAPTTPG